MSRRVFVVGSLEHEGHVLLARRTRFRTWYPGLWDLPGGRVEDTESPERALVRELHEELAITACRVQEMATVEESQRSDGSAASLRIYQVFDWSGEPRNAAPDEHDALRWVPIQELAGLELAHPEYAFLLGSSQPTVPVRR